MSTTISGITYTRIGTTSTASITSATNANLLAATTIPSTVTISSVVCTVISIGASEFINCIKLTSITIPNTVTSIGANAFQGCTSLTLLFVPPSVTSIGDNAFSSVPASALIRTYTPTITASYYHQNNSQNYIKLYLTQTGTVTNYAYSTDGTNYTELNPKQITSPLIINVSTNSSIKIKGINENVTVSGYTILGTSLPSNNVSVMEQ